MCKSSVHPTRYHSLPGAHGLPNTVTFFFFLIEEHFWDKRARCYVRRGGPG
jgi:hypothetical protein